MRAARVSERRVLSELKATIGPDRARAIQASLKANGLPLGDILRVVLSMAGDAKAADAIVRAAEPKVTKWPKEIADQLGEMGGAIESFGKIGVSTVTEGSREAGYKLHRAQEGFVIDSGVSFGYVDPREGTLEVRAGHKEVSLSIRGSHQSPRSWTFATKHAPHVLKLFETAWPEFLPVLKSLFDLAGAKG